MNDLTPLARGRGSFQIELHHRSSGHLPHAVVVVGEKRGKLDDGLVIPRSPNSWMFSSSGMLINTTHFALSDRSGRTDRLFRARTVETVCCRPRSEPATS